MNQELIKLESLSLVVLRNIEREFMETFESRKVTNPEDYYFSDVERITLDTTRFFITKRENENEGVKIGDTFYTSWGYDQTNTEHYKVIGVSPSGKTCKIRQIGSKTVKGSEGMMSDMVEPDPDFEIKIRVYDEERHQNIEQKEHLPDLQVKIERSSSFNPITQKHEQIGPINLRGSVYYAGDSKHLENLYRCKGANYRSWYA